MLSVVKIKDFVDVIVGDYPCAKQLKEKILPTLDNYPDKQNRETNVKATMTDWFWGKESPLTKNLARFIINECQRHYPLDYWHAENEESVYIMQHLWANIYHKGDHAFPHSHSPSYFSFVYFLKTKPYHSSLVFTNSNQKIRPKEGRFALFPSTLKHEVRKHRYDEERITLSGNITVTTTKSMESALGSNLKLAVEDCIET